MLPDTRGGLLERESVRLRGNTLRHSTLGFSSPIDSVVISQHRILLLALHGAQVFWIGRPIAVRLGRSSSLHLVNAPGHKGIAILATYTTRSQTTFGVYKEKKRRELCCLWTIEAGTIPISFQGPS